MSLLKCVTHVFVRTFITKTTFVVWNGEYKDQGCNPCIKLNWQKKLIKCTVQVAQMDF